MISTEEATEVVMDVVGTLHAVMADARNGHPAPDLEEVLHASLEDLRGVDFHLVLGVLAGGTAWLVDELADAHKVDPSAVIQSLGNVLRSHA